MSQSNAIALNPRLAHRLQSRYGPWAVVTGASDGIGREIALLLAQARLNVVLVARRHSILEALATDITERFGVSTSVIAVDLTDPAAAETLIDATAGLGVGLLVASAGFGTSGPLIYANVADELAMLDVNCRAVLALAHHFGGRLAQQGRGGIILMSSLLAFQGVPNAANYAATKAYIQTLAEGLHIELAPHGVDVLASAPGPTSSGFAARADMQMRMAVTAHSVALGMLRMLGQRRTARPGWLSKFLEGALSSLPRGGRVRVMGRIMKGMTQHQA